MLVWRFTLTYKIQPHWQVLVLIFPSNVCSVLVFFGPSCTRANAAQQNGWCVAALSSHNPSAYIHTHVLWIHVACFTRRRRQVPRRKTRGFRPRWGARTATDDVHSCADSSIVPPTLRRRRPGCCCCGRGCHSHGCWSYPLELKTYHNNTIIIIIPQHNRTHTHTHMRRKNSSSSSSSSKFYKASTTMKR